MNEAAAKLVRKINRLVGTLGKRGEGKPTKLTRKVKRHWDSLSHRKRGALTRQWRRSVYRSSTLVPLVSQP